MPLLDHYKSPPTSKHRPSEVHGRVTYGLPSKKLLASRKFIRLLFLASFYENTLQRTSYKNDTFAVYLRGQQTPLFIPGFSRSFFPERIEDTANFFHSTVERRSFTKRSLVVRVEKPPCSIENRISESVASRE